MRHLNIADLFPSLFNFIPRPSDHHSHNHQPTNLHSVTKLSKWFSVAQHLRTPIRARSWHPLGYAKERIRLASRTDSTPRKTQSRCAQRTFMWHGLMEFVAVVRAARRIRTTVRELRIPLHNFPSVELCRVVQDENAVRVPSAPCPSSCICEYAYRCIRITSSIESLRTGGSQAIKMV
jgi:hypothetical protein